MPKNKGKGGKNRRRGKNENESNKRDLLLKTVDQEYAKVEKMLGNGRLQAHCFDGESRLCLIRGKLRKKVWINNGDIILVGLRTFQDNKADVIMKYNSDEARILKLKGEIPDAVAIEETDDIEFTAAVDDDDGCDVGLQKYAMDLPASNTESEDSNEE